MGRPKHTTQEKIIRGDAVLAPQGPLAAAPDWLDEVARDRYEIIRAKCPWLSNSDEESLTCYAVAWSEFRAASEILAKEGRVAIGEQGQPKSHPAAALQRSALVELRHLSAALGLNPTSRLTKIKAVVRTPERIELDEFLFRKPKDDLDTFIDGE